MNYYVYITTNVNNTVLYIGVTNDLARRVCEHKNSMNDGFTAKYKVNKLIYYEHFDNIKYAIAREKQLKAWSRIKKINLIEKTNPDWNDLFPY